MSEPSAAAAAQPATQPPQPPPAGGTAVQSPSGGQSDGGNRSVDLQVYGQQVRGVPATHSRRVEVPTFSSASSGYIVPAMPEFDYSGHS